MSMQKVFAKTAKRIYERDAEQRNCFIIGGKCGTQKEWTVRRVTWAAACMFWISYEKGMGKHGPCSLWRGQGHPAGDLYMHIWSYKQMGRLGWALKSGEKHGKWNRQENEKMERLQGENWQKVQPEDSIYRSIWINFLKPEFFWWWLWSFNLLPKLVVALLYTHGGGNLGIWEWYWCWWIYIW